MVITLAFVLAYWARYDLQIGGDVAAENYVPINSYYILQVALTVILLLVFQFKGLYRLPRGSTWLDEVSVVTSSTTIGIAILIVLVFGFRPVSYSRLLFGFSWVTVVILLGCERAFIGQIKRVLWARGVGVERVLVVGAGRIGQRIMQNILDQPALGYRLVGFLEDEPDSVEWTIPLIRGRADKLNGLGNFADICPVVRDYEIDEVIIALPSSAHSTILSVIDQCRRWEVDFKLVPDLYEMSFTKALINEVNGVPLIGVRDSSIRGLNLYVKRTMDVILTTIALVLLSPLILLTAILIKLDSPGPVFFRQTRVGKNGTLFTAYKFRSMKEKAEEELEKLACMNEASGPLFKIRCDPRVTRVGRVLRRTSLDEVPQLFNIVLGHMSWVGPRPGLPAEVAQYDDWHLERLELIPGLTGFWQVSGRSDIAFDEMVKLDLYYAENWSLALDIIILLKTIPAVIGGKGAY